MFNSIQSCSSSFLRPLVSSTSASLSRQWSFGAASVSALMPTLTNPSSLCKPISGGASRLYSVSSCGKKPVPTYTFSDTDKLKMTSIFSKIKSNPYVSYKTFSDEIDALIKDGLPEGFKNICEERKKLSLIDHPFNFFVNCPIDEVLPELSFKNAVENKRNLKSTFVSEAFLLCYAKLMEQEPIGYTNVNDGDVFQDIHPLESMAGSQSQKSIKPIYFHKDLANHFVRPDWVNIICLRSTEANQVETTVVSNAEIFKRLPAETVKNLRDPIYETPFDDLTVSSSNFEVGEAQMHPIIGGKSEFDIRFFENRTASKITRGQNAINSLVKLLHEIKTPVHLLPGMFLGIANNESLHGKDVGEVSEPEALKHRWMQKTVNVSDLAEHEAHIRPGSQRIING